MKLAISATGESLQSSVDARFGRAKFFVVVDSDTRAVTAVRNDVNLNAVQGAGIQAGKRVVELGVKALLTGHIGPKAFVTLQAGDVEIYTGVSGTVADAIEQLKAGKLRRAQSADVEGHW